MRKNKNQKLLDRLKLSKDLKSEFSTLYSKSKIVIAEDSVELSSLMQKILESAGYDVDVCNDGLQLEKTLDRNDGGIDGVAVDLIITDIRMPQKSGLEAISSIKRSNSHTKVIVVSAFGSDEVFEEARTIGADITLRKPFDINQLLDSVKELIG